MTEDVLASLVGSAISQSHTPLNIMGGFKKAGIYPFNPGAVSDRQLAPSKALKNTSSKAQPLTQDQLRLFEQRYNEGYDIPDPVYLEWKRENHPESVSSGRSISNPPTLSTTSPLCGRYYIMQSSEEILNDLLTFPQAPTSSRPKKRAVNSKAVEITDDDVLKQLKEKEIAAAEKERKEQG